MPLTWSEFQAEDAQCPSEVDRGRINNINQSLHMTTKHPYVQAPNKTTDLDS